jgi:hypothetical protein
MLSCIFMKAFVVARSRINRARLHGETLAKLWNEGGGEITVRAVVDPDGSGRLTALDVRPVPEEFSLLLGELLYQLRSALDACIYQATVYATGQDPPPDDDKLEFPITLELTEFPKLKKRRLMHLKQDLQDAVESVQPYNTPSLPPEKLVKNVNRSLGILNDLARKDRHRRLHVVGAWPVKNHPKFIFPLGVTLQSITPMQAGLFRGRMRTRYFSTEGR